MSIFTISLTDGLTSLLVIAFGDHRELLPIQSSLIGMGNNVSSHNLFFKLYQSSQVLFAERISKLCCHRIN